MSTGKVDCITFMSYFHKQAFLIEHSHKQVIKHLTFKMPNDIHIYKTTFSDLCYKHVLTTY